MDNPFVVGGEYRNRDGEYEVISLDGPFMVIRYTDGRVQHTNVTAQACIWEHMQLDLQARARTSIQLPPPPLPRPPRPPKGRQPKAKASRRRAQFAGLQESDFQLGTTGTSWRSREHLGGLLAQELSAEARRKFQSFSVYRRSQVHVVQPERHRDGKAAWRDAKFIFMLDTERAYYGLYIEKNNGPMDGTWRWLNLLAALGAGEALQDKVFAAMRRLGLQWEIRIASDPALVIHVPAGEQGLIWQPEAGDEETIDWREFVHRLSQIDEDKWCDLYLRTSQPKAKAIERGAHIARDAVAVYRSLLPLYDAAARGA